MTNVGRAMELIRQARQNGVEEFCVCAGSRNSPLLAVLGASDARVFSFVDERAAAFFALGRVKHHGNPVAVVTTSGTAVAELLPATIEAYYASLPLMLITADRPAAYRGTGAPQSIEQEAIFGPYAHGAIEGWNRTSPVHINIEFMDPLIDEEVAGWCSDVRSRPPSACESARRDTNPQPSYKHPLVIIGGLSAEHRDRVREFALQLNAPVYAEPLSGLREDSVLAELLITSGERMIERGRFDGVIRIGNVPALRFWRDLEDAHRALPVVHYSSSRFTGLSRGGEMKSIDDLPKASPRERDEVFFARDRQQAATFQSVLDAEPESELAMVRDLSRDLTHGTRVYLGNSLPIREWDLVASREPRGYAMEANRGANGIDGQVSTFLGWCAPGENVALLGDLTALYDLNALWIVPQLHEEITFRIVVINNRGGRIFSRVRSMKNIDRRLIENEHSLSFESWPAMFGLSYNNRDASRSIIELAPEAEASQRVWERYDELWR